MAGPYIDDEEDLDEQRRREEEDSAPPVTIGAPAPPPPDVPPVASAPVGAAQPAIVGAPPPMVPLAPVAHPDAPPVTSHALSPARQRLQQLIDQGAPPVQPLHGIKKFGDTLGKIFAPGIEQRLRYGAQNDYNRQVGEAEAGVTADKILHPEAPPKVEKWTVVPGMVGPKGQVVQEEENTGQIRYAPNVEGMHSSRTPPAPKINEVSGIPVSITDASGKEYDIKDPNLPPELKPIADRALGAHTQHITETATPKFTAEQEAYAKKLGVKPEDVTSDQWESYDKQHKQDIHITNPPEEKGVIMSVPDGKGGHVLQRILPGQPIPEGSATPTQAGSVDIKNEQGEKAGKDALQYANDYMANGAFSGPGDEALMEKFFELAKPSSGFRMTQAQIDMLKNAQDWMNSLRAKTYHALYGTWFSDGQRKDIAKTMSDLSKSRQPAGGNNSGGGDLGAAPAGKADGSTGTMADGTKVIVKGGRLHKQ